MRKSVTVNSRLILFRGVCERGVRGSRPGKSQVAIGFLRNTGTDPPHEAIFFSREVCMALLTKKKRTPPPPPLTEFSGSVHVIGMLLLSRVTFGQCQ